MEREANYVAVGAFTLLVIAMAVAFVLWYSDSGQGEYTSYEIYFNGSVAGLSPGSPVRYLGVDVGNVRRISLVPKRPDLVKVTAAVDVHAPISSATRASLGLQGITGLLYINLKQITDVAQGPLQPGERYPVIASQSSDIDAFIASLPELAGRASTLINNINNVFSDDNTLAIKKLLNNLQATSEGLPKTAGEIQKLVIELRQTTGEIRTAAENFNGIATDMRPNVREAVASLNTVSAKLASTTERLDRFMAASEDPLTHFTEQGLFELEGLLRDARSAAIEFRDLSRSLKETPSQLMFERPESGLEIKR